MEDRIRALCQRLIETDENSADYPTVAAELRSALAKQIQGIREGLKTYPLVKARRATDK